MSETLVVDGKDLILGRLASFVAKRLLTGERVAVVNAEQVVISGRREAIFKSYETWLETRTVTNPRKGPFHRRGSEALLQLSVRGMLPFSKTKGREAFHRLRVYRGVPEELAGKEKTPVPDAGLESLGTGRYLRLGELSEHLGGRP